MSTITIPVEPTLQQELQHPHDVAVAVLHDPGASPLAAVTWLSTHLSSVARVLHPVATRCLPRHSEALRAALAADHALQQELWRLDRKLTGDARVSAERVVPLEWDVARGLEEHVRCEQALVQALAQKLSADRQRALAARLAKAVRRGPTRPHPNSPLHGPLARLATLIDAGADHLRDLLDSRSWPTPHDDLDRREPGRWGSYLIGVPFPRQRNR